MDNAGQVVDFRMKVKNSLHPVEVLIVPTCKHYGIKKIATFDEDFERVDFLEVVTI